MKISDDICHALFEIGCLHSLMTFLSIDHNNKALRAIPAMYLFHLDNSIDAIPDSNDFATSRQSTIDCHRDYFQNIFPKDDAIQNDS